MAAIFSANASAVSTSPFAAAVASVAAAVAAVAAVAASAAACAAATASDVSTGTSRCPTTNLSTGSATISAPGSATASV